MIKIVKHDDSIVISHLRGD